MTPDSSSSNDASTESSNDGEEEATSKCAECSRASTNNIDSFLSILWMAPPAIIWFNILFYAIYIILKLISIVIFGVEFSNNITQLFELITYLFPAIFIWTIIHPVLFLIPGICFCPICKTTTFDSESSGLNCIPRRIRSTLFFLCYPGVYFGKIPFAIFLSYLTWILGGILLIYLVLERSAGMRVFAAIIAVTCTIWSFIDHNRMTFSRKIGFRPIVSSIKTTVIYGVILLVMLLPALAVKGVFDFYVFKALDSVDARLSQAHSVPWVEVRKDKYPFYSPLRWAGVPRVTTVATTKSIEKPVSASRALLYGCRWILISLCMSTNIILFFLFTRALLSVFSRQLVASKLGVTFYSPISDYLTKSEAADYVKGTSPPLIQDAITDNLLLTSEIGNTVFLRRDISPSGGTPWVEIPQPGKALLARWRSGCFIMNKYPLTSTPLAIVASEGHRFARMNVRLGESVVFSFRNLVGWSDSIVLNSQPSLQCGGMALGKWVVHSAKGPGYVIFDVSGNTQFQEAHGSETFEVDRLIAFDRSVIFEANANQGWLNTLLGVVTVIPREGRRYLLDSRGPKKSKNNSLINILRAAYRFR